MTVVLLFSKFFFYYKKLQKLGYKKERRVWGEALIFSGFLTALLAPAAMLNLL